MIRVTPSFNVEYTKPAFKSSLSAGTETNATELSPVQPDYNVKVPISYQKTGETKLTFDFTAHFYKLAN